MRQIGSGTLSEGEVWERTDGLPPPPPSPSPPPSPPPYYQLLERGSARLGRVKNDLS